ncbi:MAG: hypothetical protein K0R99_4881, partial [Microbacterium sp.]|nr:hypothetical protein [Microbacterium sp.]
MEVRAFTVDGSSARGMVARYRMPVRGALIPRRAHILPKVGHGRAVFSRVKIR